MTGIDAPILVTGATGNVGGEVVRLLRDHGYAVRAAVRDIAAARTHGEQNIEYVALDFAQPATYQFALQGVRKLFLMRPPAISNTKRFINPLIDAAKQAGVEHIVFLSLQGADKNRFVPHHRIETYLLASGIPWTLLRAGFFMQNLSTTHRAEIRDHSEILVPAGRGTTSFIDVRDIAAVAALALTQPGHTGKAYTLTGGQALGYEDVARTMTAVLGRQVIYRNPSILTFVRRMRQRDLALGFILVMVGIYTTARLGLAATVTPDVAILLGQAPITLQQFVIDYQACWQ